MSITNNKNKKELSTSTREANDVETDSGNTYYWLPPL